MAQDLQKAFDKYRYDSTISQKSKTWFFQQTNLLKNARVTPSRIIREQNHVSKVVPGKLYMFYYDPKFKEELPYYDTFPLVFPFRSMPNGFLGLNMHYLPYFQRVQLMTRLMQFANNKNFDETTKIKYSWSLISGVSKFKAAEACVKHYLKDHVKSPFAEVQANDWHTAMMLPVERFVGANKNKVWGDSIKI